MPLDIDLALGALNKTALRLSEQLMAPLVRSLNAAAEELAAARQTAFVLMPMNPVRVVIALSGGRDSMSMLDLMARFFYRHRQFLVSRLRVVYIHHGLSPNADAWQQHCERESRRRGLPFEAIRVHVDAREGGVEAAARTARYRALEETASCNGDDIILTAHHEDDKLETFLLQLLRGAGPDGLAGFPETRQLRLPGDAMTFAGRPVLLLRPWKNVSRTLITEYARSAKLTWVEDESNEDVTYDRNRLRHEVMPLLTQMNERFRAGASRSMKLTQDLVEGMRSVAAEDLARVQISSRPNTISVSRFLGLSCVRQKWCLRALCQSAGAVMPSQARLEDAIRQIRETGTDSDMLIELDAHELRRWADWLCVRERSTFRVPAPQTVYVTNPCVIPLPEWKGELHVIACRPGEWGIAIDRVRLEPLILQGRSGGERLKIAPNRPAKPLKDLFSEKGIPTFERDHSFTLRTRTGELLYVSRLGMNHTFAAVAESPSACIRFAFEPLAD